MQSILQMMLVFVLRHHFICHQRWWYKWSTMDTTCI